MPLNPETAETAPPAGADNLGIEVVAGRIASLTAQLAAVAEERTQRDRERLEAVGSLRYQGERTRERLRTELAQIAPEGIAEGEAAIEAAGRRWQAAIAQAGMRRRKLLRAGLEERLEELDRSAAQAREGGLRLSPAAEAELAQRREAFLAEVAALRARAAAALAGLDRCCRRAGLGLRGQPSAPVPLPTWDLDRRTSLMRNETAAGEKSFADFADGAELAACLPVPVLLAHLVAALPPLMALAGAMWLLPQLMSPELALWSAAGGLVLQGLVLLYTRFRRGRANERAATVRTALRRLDERLAELADAGGQELHPEGTARQRLERALQDDRSGKAQALKAAAETALKASQRREQAVAKRAQARFAALQTGFHAEAQRRCDERKAAAAAAIAREEEAQRGRQARLESTWAGQCAALDARWTAGLAALREAAADSLRRCAERHPAWSDAGWAERPAPTVFPAEIPVGTASRLPAAIAAASGGEALPKADGDAIRIPVALAFPQPGSLLVRFSPDSRDAALRLANQVVLRALAAFPPGKLRLGLVDPVGLGDAFAGLLELADHDEDLLGGGILNDAARIERGLDDLIAHLEVVIQKHLRGRYATIEDYNREAGEMQEALRLLVIADFPTGFGERALEKLSVLVRSGARCGVHLLVLHDDRRPIPAALDLAWFRRTGLVIREVQGRFALDRDGLHDWEFAPEEPADPDLAARLVDAIGRGAQKAKRIEVPFAAVIPPPEKLWSLSSARTLSVPIGKRGADRLQHLELGRGTAQHALIGGRTGSGKSTLFHVLITSASMWYSPAELEFHLIDFKKGVEFKAYAANRLPHARVIAIESDREFGLSVLRHLDGELTRRGDMFRKVGAQDLAAHRASGGEHLPRILLLIDEFQEFFTEDDAIARDAALLLDRFVRQGRAFGLHVVLGSQTLGGAYSLAKSSLGQMGIRIALPCNEADAHLLLHEDNDATRLLTRPGDAIYNDHAGLAEGNSPFQVCWLGEEQEAGHLRQIAERCRADGWRPAQPPVVFEGNGPSDLAEDPGLAALLARPPSAADAATRAWLGQSSSLKGPAEIAFPAAAGGNLLVVGQNREAAAATCAAIAIGLAARHAPGGLRLLTLDGEDRDGPFAALHERLAACLPHQPRRSEARDAAALLAELAELLERRQSGADPARTPVLATVFALQRLRQLRPDDDLAFGRDAGEPPAERFARLLASGPEYGIHAVVWCDSLASVQRGLSRRSLRDFDLRVLFQMSASDSTELIDDDGASRLGLHTAIALAQGEGRREKFRPYSLPAPEFLDRLGAQLRARWPAG